VAGRARAKEVTLKEKWGALREEARHIEYQQLAIVYQEYRKPQTLRHDATNSGASSFKFILVLLILSNYGQHLEQS
jgi:hypothetical protein